MLCRRRSPLCLAVSSFLTLVVVAVLLDQCNKNQRATNKLQWIHQKMCDDLNLDVKCFVFARGDVFEKGVIENTRELVSD